MNTCIIIRVKVICIMHSEIITFTFERYFCSGGIFSNFLRRTSFSTYSFMKSDGLLFRRRRVGKYETSTKRGGGGAGEGSG